MAPQIQDLRPQVDLRVDVAMDAGALWDRLIRVVPDGRHVQIARSGPNHIVCEVLGRRGRVVGEFQIAWQHVQSGTMRVRSTLLARLTPTKLTGGARRVQATLDEHYRLTTVRVHDALRAHVVPPPEATRQPIIDPELVRRVATTFAPDPPVTPPPTLQPPPADAAIAEPTAT